jgi:hypothetical protein
MRPSLAALAFSFVALSPGIALACPVCFSGNEANRTAYFLTFLLLTSLPLALIGGLVWYLRKRARELDAKDAELSR